jgi:hypothetical protein
MAMSPLVEAKRVVNATCQWFGTAPACDGECPAGWTEKRHSKTEGGQPCVFGSRVYCCDFQERCVPDYDRTWDPQAKRTRPDGVIECQSCKRYGEDCKFKGGFNTACAYYEWVPCGKTTPPPQPEPADDGKVVPKTPILVPDPNPQPPPPEPTCKRPQFMRQNGTCGCESGLTGENCDEIVVH